MAFKDLREFIQLLEKKGLLARVKVEVDSELEITEITDRVVKAEGPALFFEKVKRKNFPLVINLFGSYERMKLALEVSDLEEIGQRIRDFLKLPRGKQLKDKLEILPRLLEAVQFPPKLIKKAPCQEVIIRDKPSLEIFPIMKCWPLDGGPFITLPLIFTQDPETGSRNVGIYRMQVYDCSTTGMHWHIHKHAAQHFRKYRNQRKPMEVAVALGADPSIIFSAASPLPLGFDEMLFAGFLRKQGVEMVKAVTVNLEVPAHAEIILEGYVEPEDTMIEGPFGDHTGYYSLADEYPVFRLTCITHRKDAIYPSTIVGKPPMEDCFIAKAIERIFFPLIQFFLPEIVDINLPLEGVFHNCAIVSITKTYPGQARKVMQALWGLEQMMFTKIIIVVEEDTDVQNLSQVAWRVFNHFDPSRSLVISEGPLDILDHASNTFGYGAKLGIDATRPWKEEGRTRPWPEEVRMDNSIKELVSQRWKEYGIKI